MNQEIKDKSEEAWSAEEAKKLQKKADAIWDQIWEMVQEKEKLKKKIERGCPPPDINPGDIK